MMTLLAPYQVHGPLGCLNSYFFDTVRSDYLIYVASRSRMIMVRGFLALLLIILFQVRVHEFICEPDRGKLRICSSGAILTVKNLR